MGRPPSNGVPAFRFNQSEVAEMENVLQEYNNAVPAREVLEAIAEKFSEAPDRKGKIIVQMKQVWNWFQNRRYAIRAKSSKPPPGKLNISSMRQDDSDIVKNVPPTIAAMVTAPVQAPSAPSTGRFPSENSVMEFEAKSARDGAWYDVSTFLSHRNLETGDPEVLVRFAGFGPDEDEWVNVKKHVRQRSLPCESSECVAVLPGDLILCFQEGKEQALYFDARVLDAQRRRHDVRGCRCRFLVCYEHDQSEEIVPLRKICRRPETEYRLQQLHAANELASADQQKLGLDPSRGSIQRIVHPQAEAMQKQHIVEVAKVTPVLRTNMPAVLETTNPEPKAAESTAMTNVESTNASQQVAATSTSSVPTITTASNSGHHVAGSI